MTHAASTAPPIIRTFGTGWILRWPDLSVIVNASGEISHFSGSGDHPWSRHEVRDRVLPVLSELRRSRSGVP